MRYRAYLGIAAVFTAVAVAVFLAFLPSKDQPQEGSNNDQGDRSKNTRVSIPATHLRGEVVHVLIYPAHPESNGQISLHIDLNKEEHAAHETLQPGNYVLMAYTRNGRWAEVDPLFIDPRKGADVSISLNPGCTIHGTFVWHDHDPQKISSIYFEMWNESAKAWMTLRYHTGGEWRAITPKEDNTFEAHVPPTRLRLKIEHRPVCEIDCTGQTLVDLGKVHVRLKRKG